MSTFIVLVDVNSNDTDGQPTYKVFQNGAFISDGTSSNTDTMNVSVGDTVLFIAVDDYDEGYSSNTVDLTVSFTSGTDVFAGSLESLPNYQSVWCGTIASEISAVEGDYTMSGSYSGNNVGTWSIDPKISVSA